MPNKGSAVPLSPDVENSIHVEIEGTKDAKKLSLEDKVEITIRGTVAAIDQRKAWDDEDRTVTEIRLTNYSSKLISVGDTTFSDLADD